MIEPSYLDMINLPYSSCSCIVRSDDKISKWENIEPLYNVAAKQVWKKGSENEVLFREHELQSLVESQYEDQSL